MHPQRRMVVSQHRLQDGKVLCQKGGIRKDCSKRRMGITTPFSIATEQCRTAQRAQCFLEYESGLWARFQSNPQGENTTDCGRSSIASVARSLPHQRARLLKKSPRHI